RRVVRRPAGDLGPRRGPPAHGVPARAPRGAGARGRRRRRRAPLLRLVPARQLRVGARLRQALRDRVRGLPHAAAVGEAERAVVPRFQRVEEAGGGVGGAFFRGGDVVARTGAWGGAGGASRASRVSETRAVAASGPFSMRLFESTPTHEPLTP